VKAVVICCDRIPTRLLGAYGSEWVETPHLDRLAAHGIVFDNLYATKLDGETLADGVVGSIGDSFEIALVSDRYLRAERSADSTAPWQFVEAPVVGDPENVPLDRVLSDPQRRVPSTGRSDIRRWIERWRRQIARDEIDTPGPDACEQLFAAAAARWDEQADSPDVLVWIDVALADGDWIPPKHWRDRRMERAEEPSSLLDPAPGRVGEPYHPDDRERVAAPILTPCSARFFRASTRRQTSRLSSCLPPNKANRSASMARSARCQTFSTRSDCTCRWSSGVLQDRARSGESGSPRSMISQECCAARRAGISMRFRVIPTRSDGPS
jgi:hypothetical protein